MPVSRCRFVTSAGAVEPGAVMPGERGMTAVQTGFWRDRPTLVTGATGLIASWVVRRLLELEADVVCIMRDWAPQSELVQADLIGKTSLVQGDVLDQALLERVLGEYEVDTVIHLAAQTIVGVANRNPISTFESNIAGTWRLLEACRRSPLVRQGVLASSDKAYGDQETLPYTEATALAGRHPYDVSKSCADLIAQSYAVTYDSPVVITRCGNFFGGGDLNWSRIVPGTIRSVLRRQAPVIRSDGRSRRDYFYVEDGADAYLLLADAPHFERFGEIYFSVVYPGAIKAWHLHKRMTLNYAVVSGAIKLVLYDDRDGGPTHGELMELFIGDGNYCLVTVPAGVWN